MYHSFECRWFTEQSFLCLNNPFLDTPNPEIRTDWYAPICNEACGIKLRNGRLETKLREAQHGETCFHSHVGMLEEWCKWGVAIEAPPADELLLSSGWLKIRKKRYSHLFDTSGDVLRLITDKGLVLKNGCLFEITELSVSNTSYWTIGFEAFGVQQSMINSLQRVATEVLGNAHISQLTVQQSYAYPRFLLSL